MLFGMWTWVGPTYYVGSSPPLEGALLRHIFWSIVKYREYPALAKVIRCVAAAAVRSFVVCCCLWPVCNHNSFLTNMQLLVLDIAYRQCFDTVGWASGRTSGL